MLRYTLAYFTACTSIAHAGNLKNLIVDTDLYSDVE
jgi:hypothetical protein